MFRKAAQKPRLPHTWLRTAEPGPPGVDARSWQAFPRAASCAKVVPSNWRSALPWKAFLTICLMCKHLRVYHILKVLSFPPKACHRGHFFLFTMVYRETSLTPTHEAGVQGMCFRKIGRSQSEVFFLHLWGPTRGLPLHIPLLVTQNPDLSCSGGYMSCNVLTPITETPGLCQACKSFCTASSTGHISHYHCF
jgi:hypothetical protein